jgi:tetratricopeptide (TPR) repeat protein
VAARNEQARSLLASGKHQEALEAVAGRSDAESLTIQGRAFMLKARQESDRTSIPPESAGSEGMPALRPSESAALSLLERAVDTQPDLADAHLALAELLEPNALIWHARQRESAAQAAATRKATSKASPSPSPVPAHPLGPERVMKEYRQAAHADRTSIPIVEAWLRFAQAVGRADESEIALQELVVRSPRNAEVLVRYGDFLRDVRGDSMGSLEKYGQAAIWLPSDPAIQTRIVEVYLQLADAHLKAREYGAADQRLRDASRYLTLADSAVKSRHAALRERLSTIRGR